MTTSAEINGSIIPPAPVFGQPFTKLIKVSLNHLGTIDVSSFTQVDGEWEAGDTAQGTLKSGSVVFDMGVEDEDDGRGVLTTDAEDWIDVWAGSTQQLVGRHPDAEPFVFGQANFAGGAPGIFAAPGLVHKVTKISGKKALKLVTAPGEPRAGGLKPLSDRVTTTAIAKTTPVVALVLWLEQDQGGFVKFKRMPTLNKAVKIEV